MKMKLQSFSELKKHEKTQDTRTGNTFYWVLGSLSSCDHLDLEKSPSVRETNGRAAGSRYIGRSDSLQSFWSKLQQSQTYYFHPTVYPPAWCRTSDNILDPLSFFFPFFPLGLGALAEGRQEETPQWARQCLWETLLYPQGFFLFPVWSAGESFSTSCQSGASATRPHCLLHTDLILQPQRDLLYCYYSLPCFFSLPITWRVAVFSVFCCFKHWICEWKQGRCITSLLSATMISSTYLVVFWVCLLCWRKNRDAAG